jgi:hypothetical protein
MALFTAEGLSYEQAIALINELRQSSIEANITAGGVAIYPDPSQINQAKDICSSYGASFGAGYTTHQEDVFFRCGSIDHAAKVRDDAISLIKEWED